MRPGRCSNLYVIARRNFLGSIVRDLRRALEDPAKRFPNDVPEGDLKAVESLPSPKRSPKKGVSAEHVKYARDLCTTSHSAMKFLALVMGSPAIYKLFDGLLPSWSLVFSTS